MEPSWACLRLWHYPGSGPISSCILEASFPIATGAFPQLHEEKNLPWQLATRPPQFAFHHNPFSPQVVIHRHRDVQASKNAATVPVYTPMYTRHQYFDALCRRRNTAVCVVGDLIGLQTNDKRPTLEVAELANTTCLVFWTLNVDINRDLHKQILFWCHNACSSRWTVMSSG